MKRFFGSFFGVQNRSFGERLGLAFVLFLTLGLFGCATQKGKIVDPNSSDRVGSHRAGSEIYDPAAQAAVAGLLEQAATKPIMPEDVGKTVAQIAEDRGVRKICFVGVENAGGEEMGDLREDLTETIRTMITQSDQFDVIDSRVVAAGLRETGLRVDDLLLPDKREHFANALGELNAPFVVNVHTSASIRETVGLKKHYNRSLRAKIKDAL